MKGEDGEVRETFQFEFWRRGEGGGFELEKIMPR